MRTDAGQPPRVLAERFEIVAQLGVGTMGEVYRARDRARDQEIALKVLPALEATALMRFKHEFRALHGVQHPNLVELHELHEDHGTWFFTMQLVDGVDFLTWVGDDEARLRDALGQVARALHRLHRSGLVHRDVKPSNILVTRQGRAVLLDFGLVVPAWAPGEAAGTPAFMAPEQIDGDVTPAADWYAVGVLLFRALTGRLPFVGAPEQVMQAKLREPPRRVHDVRPAAPRDLAALADRLLARAPSARPSGERVLAALGAGREDIGVAGPLVVGRDAELALLGQALAERLSGAPVAVSVAGESGIGKTTLLGAFAQDIEQSGSAWVLAGRCWERESVPYKGFDAIVDELVARLEGEPWELDPRGWGPSLVQAFPVLRRLPAFSRFELVTSVGGRHTAARVSSAVRWLIGEVATHQPLVLIVDDLQWADRDTSALLRGLLEPPVDNVLLVAGAREHVTLAPKTPMRTLSLGPLTSEDTASLVRMVARELDVHIDPDVIAREAAGHPLFAAELARHAAATGSVGSISFETAVREIAARVGPTAHHVMQTVSVAHAPLSSEATGRATGLDGAELYDMLDALRAAQLVATSGVGTAWRIEPAHDRVRHVFVSELATDEARAVHERLAIAMEAEPTQDPQALALHWSDAGQPARAARHAMRAAEQAEAALAFHRAARLYKWVSELDPAHADAPLRYAEALAQAGLGVDAADAYLACARRERGVASIDLRRRAMQQLLLMGHTDRALRLLDELARELSVPNPKRPGLVLLALLRHRLALRRRALVLSPPRTNESSPDDLARLDMLWDAAAGLALVDPVRGFYFQSRGLDLAFRTGDRPRLARALLGETPYLAAPGKPSERVADLQRLADEVSEQAGFPALSRLCRGTFAFFFGQWRACHELLEDTERLLLQERPRLVKEGVGPAQLLDITRRFLLVAMLYRGQLRAVQHRLPELLHDAIERNDISSATHLRTGVQSLAYLAADEVDAATRHADDGIAPWRDRRIGVPHFMDLQARTNIDIYAGRALAAYDRVLAESRRFGGVMLRVQYLNVALLDIRGRAALAAARLATGRRRARALRDARRCAARLRGSSVAWGVALGDGLRAGVAIATGDRAAPELLARAATSFSAADMIAYACNARLASGDETARGELVAAGIADVDAYSQLLLPR